MKYPLSELAVIKIGYQARGCIKPDPDGSYRIIQFKDIDNIEGLKLDDLYTILPERGVENASVYKGDVLFLSRGSRNVACHVASELDYTIAASNIYIVRLKEPAAVVPAYLAWYINQSSTQATLKDMARGVTIQTIPKSIFETLEIEVPSLDVQHKVAHLTVLHQREQMLTKKLTEKREQLIQAICQKAVKRAILKDGK